MTGKGGVGRAHVIEGKGEDFSPALGTLFKVSGYGAMQNRGVASLYPFWFDP